ncbi:MAG: hypothetical protein Q7S13_04740 [Candidatus Omnitrophota bacterium]|nr:hypothetical protein [Candidatus Omnitrophota bacterium]
MIRPTSIEEKKKLSGITIFASLLIFAAAYKLLGLLNDPYYQFMFQQLPAEIIPFRYAISIVWRLMAIAIAVGLLKHLEVARKFLLVMCAFSLIGLCWKHPFFIFQNIALLQEQQFFMTMFPPGTTFDHNSYPVFPEQIGTSSLKFPLFPVISFAFYTGLDIIFSLTLMFYFTRPRVKEAFQ